MFSVFLAAKYTQYPFKYDVKIHYQRRSQLKWYNYNMAVYVGMGQM